MSTEAIAAGAAEAPVQPAVPPHPADYHSNPAAREAHWKATVAAFEAASTAAPSPVVEPNADDMAVINKTGEYRLADGRPAVFANSEFRGLLERLRADVLGGKPLDRAAATAEVARVLGLPMPAAAPGAASAEQPAPPQGTPADREQERLDAVATRIDAGEVVEVSELPPDALCGYEIKLPAGFGLTGEHLGMLATARAANIPQATIDAFIAAQVAASQ